jgi:hypothetical protein
MRAIRRNVPIALGTWSRRGLSVPRPDESRFVPVDIDAVAAAHSQKVAARNRIYSTQRRYSSSTGGPLDMFVMAGNAAASLNASLAKRQASQLPKWAISGVSRAAGDFLGEVAMFCLDQPWGSEVRAVIIGLVPDLEVRFQPLEVAVKGFEGSGNYESRAEAEEFTSPVLRSAREITELLSARFRVVPAPPSKGSILRITSRQWSKALHKAVDSYDQLTGDWHDFIFSSPRPSDRMQQLDALGKALAVEGEIGYCEKERLRCQELAGSEVVTRVRAKQRLERISAAVAAWENAMYKSESTRSY